jgi:hypothetical protein
MFRALLAHPQEVLHKRHLETGSNPEPDESTPSFLVPFQIYKYIIISCNLKILKHSLHFRFIDEISHKLPNTVVCDTLWQSLYNTSSGNGQEKKLIA